MLDILYRCLGALVFALILGAAPDGAGAGPSAIPEPEGYRADDYRSPVPATLRGARVIDAEEARELLGSGPTVFIDVFPRPPKPANLPAGTIWRDPVHDTIEGAVWLPNVGYGMLSPAVERYFREQLARLTHGKPEKPLVIFCQRDCWMSWNAAKRALEWGYSNVFWFSEGTDAWLDLGESLVQVEPEE